jgi:steroid 5-alpha reductase family enzyme
MQVMGQLLFLYCLMVENNIMLTIFLQGFLLLMSLLTILWIVSVFIKDASIVDIFWGMTFVVTNTYYFFATGDLYTRKIILIVLVTLWGLRLSIFLAYRNIGKGEDYRYQEFRKKYGPERYWWFSFFQVYLLQGIFSILVSVTLLGAHFNTQNNDLNFLDYLGILVWLIGFIFEAGGDYQITKFKKNPENKGRVLNTGFWKYTRHPNYFGDSAVWWAYAIFSIAAGSYWTIVGSFIMTFLLLKVSGVALLEKSLKAGKPEYNDYIQKTNSFLPWFPKK